MKNFIRLLTCIMAAVMLFTVAACSRGGGGMKRADNEEDKTSVSAPASNADPTSTTEPTSADAGEQSGQGNEEPDPQPTYTTVNLMQGFSSAEVEPVNTGDTFTAAYNTFATNLFKQLYKGENLLISPLSVEIALSMTANGAKGNTLSEMENVLFNGGSLETFNVYNMSYIKNLTGNEKVKINLANSIWVNAFRGDVDVKNAFLQANADYYNAAAYKAPFNDATLADLNGWVKQETDGLIDKILDELTPDEIMYLINATSFDAHWQSEFEAENTYTGTFTPEAGKAKEIKMMPDVVHKYLENDFAEGFIKEYYGGRYAFVAMLPKKGVTIADAVSRLDAKTIKTYMASVARYTTHIRVPKFKVEYEEDIIPALSALGMSDLFSAGACDLSGLAVSPSGNVYVDLVKHKTMIEVDEAGTKAAAVTIVGVRDGAAGPDPDAKYVYLDRPFVYFIMDTQTNTPIFMGTYEK